MNINIEINVDCEGVLLKSRILEKQKYIVSKSFFVFLVAFLGMYIRK
jgi:hypothetical protein